MFIHGRIPTEQLAEEKQGCFRSVLQSSGQMLCRDHIPSEREKTHIVFTDSQLMNWKRGFTLLAYQIEFYIASPS